MWISVIGPILRWTKRQVPLGYTTLLFEIGVRNHFPKCLIGVEILAVGGWPRDRRKAKGSRASYCF